MESYRASSLFLYILIVCSNICTGQTESVLDSVNYYYQKANDPKSGYDKLEAYSFYSHKKADNLRDGDTLNAISNLRMIVICQTDMAIYYEAKSSAVEALDLIDRMSNGNKEREIYLNANRKGIYNSLGIIYRTLNDHENALKTYNAALLLTNETESKNSLYMNIANVYMDLGKYERAREKYELVYQNRLLSNNQRKIASALDNLGFAQGKLNEPTAVDNMLRALKIRIDENENSKIYTSYKHLSEYYLDRKELTLAKKYADLGYEATVGQNVTYKLDALSVLINLSTDSLAINYIKLNDSIQAANQREENKYAYQRYNVEKEQKRTLEAELKSEKERSNRLLAQYLGATLFIGGIFLFFFFRAKHKKEKIQEIYKVETRISRKIHDEVANDVYHIMSMIQSKTNMTNDIIDNLEVIYEKTRDISKESSAIEVDEDFDELLNDLLLSYKNEHVNIITKNISKINWKLLNSDKKTALYRALQELMTNMKKHSKASLVALTFLQKNSKLTVNYNDNGIGCNLRKNNGLNNAENRIHTINGTITFESEPNRGFKAQITV